MAEALSCGCERLPTLRISTLRVRAWVASSGGCSGEATRDRLGPSLATAAVDRNAIGRGPVVVFA